LRCGHYNAACTSHQTFTPGYTYVTIGKILFRKSFFCRTANEFFYFVLNTVNFLPVTFLYKAIKLKSQFLPVDTKYKPAAQSIELFCKYYFQLFRCWREYGQVGLALRKRKRR